MGVDHFETNEVHVLDTTSTRVNPATEETLQAVVDAVDGLELSADTININLEDLETLVAATNAAIASLEAANDLSGDDVVSAIQTAQSALEAALGALQASNETHSDEEQAAIASLEAAVAAFHTAFDVRDLATETTLADLLASTGDETDAEATADGSVIAILKRIRTRLDQSITDFNAEDFASETTLGAFKAANNADIQALIAANDISGDDIVTAIQALEAASDASGDDIVTAINDCCVTIEASLTAIEASVDAFKAAFDARDLATETTLADARDNIEDIRARWVGGYSTSVGDGHSGGGALRTEGHNYGYNGADWDRLRSSIANGLEVDATILRSAPTIESGLSDVETSVDELKAQNLTKHDSIISELQDVEADIEAFKAEAHADSLDTQAAVDELKAVNQAEFDATQTLLQTEFDETQAAIVAASAQNGLDLQDVEDAVDELKAVNQAEFDATQALLQAEFDATQTLLQTEFDETQTAISNASAQNSADLQSIEDNQTDGSQITQVILPTLEEAMKVKLDLTYKWKSAKTIVGTTKTTYTASAPVGTATSAALWVVVRIIEDLATGDSQIEGRANIAYDNRADPTIDGEAAWEAL